MSKATDKQIDYILILGQKKHGWKHLGQAVAAAGKAGVVKKWNRSGGLGKAEASAIIDWLTSKN